MGLVGRSSSSRQTFVFWRRNSIMMKSAVDEDFFPILAWGGAPGDLDTLRNMAECGITVAGFVAPEHLDLVEQAGLKAFVRDARASGHDFRNLDIDKVSANVVSLTQEVGSHPAVFGYYVRDEPSADMFPGLAAVSKAFLIATPGKVPYINLFPNYTSQRQLGTETYEEHVEMYVTSVDPPIISYDHYALMEYEPLRKGYFANLETIRRASLKYKRPFWNIVLSNAHFRYREPSAADIRFQVFTTLAYGGKGISYFTYFAPDAGNYRMAPIDQFGNRTPAWYYLQNVNLVVQKLAPTLLKLTSTGVYHVGDVPEGCMALPGNTLVSVVHGSADFLVGEFIHSDGFKYVMLVNRDFHNSTNFRLELNDPGARLQRVSPYTGQLYNLAGENDWLAPGQGVLLRVMPGD